MATESNIPPDDITVLLNGVDVERFRRGRTSGSRPTRALFFNSRHSLDSDTVSAIREATSNVRIDLDFIGTPFGRLTAEPERILPGYDIVFASGKSAIEALACGCAVIVLGRTSCGDMVRMDNVDRFRRANFTIAVNSPPPSASAIAAELRRFSAEDCAAVTERVRHDADFRRSVATLVRLYEQAIERHRATAPDPAAEMLAMSRYLRRIVPLIKMTDRMLDGQWSSPTRADSFDELHAQFALLQQRLERARCADRS